MYWKWYYCSINVFFFFYILWFDDFKCKLNEQKEPPERPKLNNKMVKQNEKRNGNEEEQVLRSAWQMWHRNGTRCPKGTVPVRRSTVQDVLRSKSLFNFGKKRNRIGLDRRTDAPDVVSGNGHEVCYHFFSLPLFMCSWSLLSFSLIFWWLKHADQEVFRDIFHMIMSYCF